MIVTVVSFRLKSLSRRIQLLRSFSLFQFSFLFIYNSYDRNKCIILYLGLIKLYVCPQDDFVALACKGGCSEAPSGTVLNILIHSKNDYAAGNVVRNEVLRPI